jgi:hypothetical protein
MTVRPKKLEQHGIVHHLALIVIVLGVAMFGSYEFVASHAATQPSTIIGLNGKCLTNASGTKRNNNPVILSACASSVKQTWTVNAATTAGSIVNNNGYCLDVYQAKKANKTQVVLLKCNSKGVGQQWTFNSSTGAIKNPHSGKCLTAKQTSAQNGWPAIISTCASTASQDWTIKAKTTTPPPTPTPTPKPPTPTPTPTPTPSPTPTPTPTPSPSPTPTPTSKVSCNYQTDTWSGDASSVGYSVTKVANKDGNPASFSVKLNAKSGTTEVVGYPSDQCIMYSALPTSLTSSFSNTPPASSNGLDYEYAYDIWLTTASAATSNNWDNDLELMIWTYTNGQQPAGSVKSTLSDGSKVWVAGNNTSGTVSVVLPKNETSGTINIASIVSQLKSLSYVSSTYNGILDTEYGIEAPYGGGQTFTVGSVSIAE